MLPPKFLSFSFNQTTPILHVRSVCCVAMENDMTRSELRSFHPVEAKEITPFGAWLITRVVIAMAGILSFVPFVIYFWQHG